MAGYNSPFSSSSISSLLRSAISVRSSIDAYNDEIAAYEYKTSAHTDDAFAKYKTYLKGRIDSLKGGDLSSQQKALTLTNTLDAAYHANVSANIQRANIAIMAGGATLRDKYQLISDQFGHAVANGDYTLAQSLESQAYSVSQQIQYEENQAATAAQSLAEATARAGARSEVELADTLKAKLEELNTNYAHAGEKTASKMLSDFVKENGKMLDALSIHLQPGVAPNYFDVVDGINRAIYKAYTLAGDAVAPFAADGGQSYYDKASGVFDRIPTIYGNMNAQQLLDAANNPTQFSYNAAPDYKEQGKGDIGGKQNPQVGYRYTSTGQIVPVVANTPWVDVPNSFKSAINALGLETVGQSKDGGVAYTVHATAQSPDWVKQILGGNATSVVTVGNQQLGTPGIQLEADAQDGPGKAVYTITFDQQGKKAVWESSALGDRLVTSDQGYDSSYAPNAKDYTPQAPPSFWSRIGDGLGTAFSTFGSMINPTASAMGASKLVANAQETARQQAEDAAARALLAKPLQLPKLSIAKPPALPPLAIAKPKVAPALTVRQPKALPVNQKTVNPQPAAQLAVQGGSGTLLQGGGGISLQ